MSLVIKRNKKAQKYSQAKVENTLKKTFKVTHRELPDYQLKEFIDALKITDGMSTNDIQTQLENILMKKGFLNEARYLIIYRHINYHTKDTAAKVRFMKEYFAAKNAATGSKFDANANVTEKNLATLTSELFKKDVIDLNRYRLRAKIEEMYGKELADEYIEWLEKHRGYKHDESSIKPYCVATTMYPFLLDGIKSIGGLSAKPQNLDSYCGMFVNYVFAVAAQFAGAVATGEFLMYFDYFARKEWGNDYWSRKDEFHNYGSELIKLQKMSNTIITTAEDMIPLGGKKTNPQTDVQRLAARLYSSYEKGKLIDGSRTIESMLEQYFQQVVYSINQPAAARDYQSVFWNISYFDKYYFDGMFHDFRFPDGTAPMWDSLNWLQKKFMKWFNKERERCILTFPVETVAMLTEGNDIKDKEWADFTAEMWSEGHSFFCYLSDNPDSLSSCCRLRNEVKDNQFSYSLGAGGIATGSKSVMTININRLVQDAIRDKKNYLEVLREQIRKVHKYQTAFNELLKEYKEQGALQIYDAGFISLDKQYLTLGVNGFVEAAEFLGIEPKPTEEYKQFCDGILRVFNEENKAARTKELMFNTEFVPAENLGAKFYKWDKEDGYVVPKNRVCYNSYFYAVEDTSISILDKFKLHGKDYVRYLDGGSALHMNLDSHLSKEQYRQLLRVAAKEGTNYFTFNIPNTVCPKCGHIDKRYLKACPKCGNPDVDYATRVIGYLKLVSNFSQVRQDEAGMRYYTKNTKEEQKLIDDDLTDPWPNGDMQAAEGCPPKVDRSMVGYAGYE